MTVPVTDKEPGRIAALLKRISGDREGIPTSLADLRGSETAKAAGLAGAMIANNVIALISTVVFARLLSDYGSLAALVSYFLILSVVGQALQVATAREGVLGHLGVGAGLTATVRRWTVHLMMLTAGITVVSILLRAPIASAVGVQNDQWAAAIGLPAGMLWLEISILRGVLQGVGDYNGVGVSLVGEQAARLVSGAALAAAGLGVTGAYLGTPISFLAVGVFCLLRLRRHVETQGEAPLGVVDTAPPALSLWTHVKRAWAPIAGLIVIAVLQNIDIIAAKHRFTRDLASSYGATAVAAKVLVWVAIGAGFYLVPEVSRRRALGEDTRPILFRALGIILVCAVPVLLIFGVEPKLLLKLAFGAKRDTASGSLLVLGVAFTVLACTYLAIQYLLALRRTWFLIAVGAVAVAEPILLLNASRRATGFATVVLGIQAVGALLAFGLAFRAGRAPPPGAQHGHAPTTGRDLDATPEHKPEAAVAPEPV
ncbi:MAG: lipopolysaccharide biosynthesis protein [Solirubrobacteraceae bacterium]